MWYNESIEQICLNINKELIRMIVKARIVRGPSVEELKEKGDFPCVVKYYDDALPSNDYHARHVYSVEKIVKDGEEEVKLLLCDSDGGLHEATYDTKKRKGWFD
ncbi:hypothetical protein IKF85_02240 [Candidatus Saccharibacteria bacterium]|nr:hypothetical protein [Candidatus Saccharibacteria bacterium]